MSMTSLPQWDGPIYWQGPELDMWKFFTPKELACRCCGKLLIQEPFYDRLVACRIVAGIPFIVNSGFRCLVHNMNEGGSKSSSHMFGWAADIAIGGSRDRYIIVNAAMSVGITTIEVLGGSWVHLSADPRKDSRILF